MINTVVHAVRILLDDIFDANPYIGLTSYAYPSAHTSNGSAEIHNIANTDLFYVGRKVRVSKGFPSATALYKIISKTTNTITVDTLATSSETGVIIEEQSEIDIAETALYAGILESFSAGILIKDSIDSFTEKGDLSRGGNIPSYDGLSIAINNAGREYDYAMRRLGIFLTGKTVEVIRFIGTETDADLIERKTIFTGICEDIDWNETTVIIPIKNNRFKRDADLSTTITEGENKGSIVPLTFGSIYPDDSSVIDRLAKLLRTDDTEYEDIYTNEFFTGAYPLINIFPLEAKDDDTTYVCYTNGNVTKTGSLDVSNDDVYVFVKSGTGAGQIRQVLTFQFYSPSAAHFLFTIKDVFYTELSLADDGTRAWMQFIKISRLYKADIWPCKSFLDELGVSTVKPLMYSYTDEKYNRIADYGFTVATANNNSLDIDGQQYSEDINKLKSFLILPVVSLAKETSATLAQWYVYSTYNKMADAVYIHPDGDMAGSVTPWMFDEGYSHDKISSSFSLFNPIINFTNFSFYRRITLAMKFSLPIIPKGLKISKIYVGAKIKTNASVFDIAFRRFNKTVAGDVKVFSRNPPTGDDPCIDDIPDFYYTDNPSTNNLHFYKTSVVDGGGLWQNIFGYSLFELPNCTYDIYNTYMEGAIFLNYKADTAGEYTPLNKIYELAIILELEDTDIKKDIYSPLSGRIFNDTFGSRKTAANLIENPVDIIEHLRRLGNWSETGINKNFGKEYSDTAKIKTSGEGSFDDSYLTDVKLCRPSFQVMESGMARVNEIVKELCDSYGLCSYIDSDGNECIKQISQEEGSSELITIKDITGTIGNIIEPKSEYIYCEPILNYQYDYGRNNFNKQLKITNITAPAWLASYTEGFSGVDGQAFWNFCKGLYNEYGTIQKCSPDFSDKKFISTYADALYYLSYKLNWINKRRIELSILYTKGKNYHFGQHVNIRLPHQTGDVELETVIESVTKNKKNVTIKLGLLILT